MAKFKVGDRVRIVKPTSTYGLNGKTGTVHSVGRWNSHDKPVLRGEHIAGGVCYLVDVDKYGARAPDGVWIGYAGSELRPLINPDEQAWIAFKSLHLKPDPALILAKENA